MPASESAACGPIAKAPATLSATISGEAKEGATLSAAVGGLPADSTAEVSVTWQMSDDGKDWADFAAGETVVLGPDQIGKYVRCVASAGDDAIYAVAAAPSGACGPVKSLQAFAVYSADDNSLNFYKRYDVPSAGNQFEGKTATAVYTGIEDSDYSDRSAVPWADHKADIVTVEAVDTIRPKSMAWWFAMMDVKDSQGGFCAPLSSVDLTKVDASSCESMAQLFCKAANLSSIKGVEGWDTSSCTTMKGVFNGTAVGSLNLSGWDTSRVSDMSMAFMSCTHLTDLDVSGWDTSSCTTMRKLFSFCRSLASLDVSGWDTSSCVTMRELFYYCSSLTSLDVSKWNTSKVTDLYYTFSNCKSLTSLDVSDWDTSSCVTMSGLFSECISLTSLDLSGWSVSNVADLSFMCATIGNKYMKLTTVGDLSAWDTSKNTSLAAMFQDCEYLESIGDISGWNTSKVTSMNALFNRCVRLDGIGDLSGWDVSSSKSFDYTFCGKGMTKTGMEIDASFVRSWDVSSAVDFDGMFKCCTAQEELDLSKWDVSGAETASEIFNGMTGLKKVSLPASWKWLDGGYLPVPSVDYIAGADTLWHAKSDGKAYEPEDIPSGKADTYYAVAPTWAGAGLSVSGDAKIGSTLRASASGVPAWASLKYQWYRDGSAIDGADSDAYVCGPDDLGHKLACKATEASGKISGELSSDPTAAVGKGSAVLSGTLSTYTPSVNSAVKATVSGVPDAGTNKLTYTWAVADSASAATWTTVKTTAGTTATSDSYTPTPAVAGKYLRCTVSGENTYFVLTSCARTSATAVAQGELATGSAKATLSGEAAYGQTLTAKATGLPSGAVAKYQWYRGTTAISGETSQTYKLAKADIGQQIKCVVTDGSGGYKGSLSSAATNAVAKAKAQASVSISGVAKIDQTLTANVAGLPDGGNTVHYQWAYSHNGGPWTDAGQNSPTYKVTHGIDNKYRVTVTVSGNPCYDVAGATSEAFGPIAKADAAAPTVKVSGTQTIGNRLTASVSGQPRGTTATAYQWQYSSDGGKTWTNSANDGAKTASMLLQPDGTLGKLYRCAVATANDYYDVPMAYSAATSPIGKGTYGAPTAAIAGGKAIESALTCNVSGQPAGTTSTSYQWQYSSDGKTWKDSTQSDAKSREFTPNYTWVNLYARCIVTTSNDYYDVAQAATAAFGPFGKKTVSVSAALGGSAAAGGTLTCSVSGLPAHGTNAVSYQWQWSSDKSKWTNSSYSDAKTNSLKLQGADVGHYYRCVVSVSGNKYYDVNGSATAASAAIGKGTAPAPTVTVSGDAEVGSTLTAIVSGQPAGTTSTSYQWQRADSANGAYSNISGANGKTYVLTTADLNKYLKCVVGTTSTYYIVPSKTSDTYGVIGKGMASAPTVTISGAPTYGQTLTANVSGQPTGTTATTYLWQRCDSATGTFSNISGATSSTYKLGVSDVGKHLKCVATTANTYYNVGNGTSSASAQIAKAKWNTTPRVRIKGIGGGTNYAFFLGITVGLLPSDATTEVTANVTAPTLAGSSWQKSANTTLEKSVVSILSPNMHIGMMHTLIKNGTDIPVEISFSSPAYEIPELSLYLRVYDYGNDIYTDSVYGKCTGDIADFSKSTLATQSLSVQESPVVCSNSVAVATTEEDALNVGEASSSYFTDADGKWYALSNGAGYVPSAIPSSKEDTYYASKPLRDAAAGSGDESGDADEIAPIPTQEQGVAARSLPADGEDEASAAPSVEVSLELAGDGSRAAGPVAVTLSGDAGDARAVLGKEGAKVALAPGRYLVSCLPAPEADGSMADAPAPFWIEASEGMGPVEIAIGSASRRPAADVQARAEPIESWLAAAAGSVPEADAEALRSAAASALSACQPAEAASEASDGSE